MQKPDQRELKQAALWRWCQLVHEIARDACATSRDNYPAAIETIQKAIEELRALHGKAKIQGFAELLNPKTRPEFVLLCWAKTLYDSALEACEKTGAYTSNDRNVPYARKLVPILAKAARDLNDLGTCRSRTWCAMPLIHAASVGTGCDDNNDCLDDTICVQGFCEPL